MSALLEDTIDDPQLPPPQVARKIRVRAGLSQGQLARALGVARATLIHWETGAAAPSELLAYRYAVVLHRLARGGSA